MFENRFSFQILKGLNGITNPDERFNALLKRSIESEKINKTLIMSQKQNQRLFENLTIDFNQTKDIK